MAQLTFNQQVVLTLIDKVVIGGLFLLAAYALNKLLETFKSDQAEQLEAFKGGLARQLEDFKSERAQLLEVLKSQLAAKDEAARNLRQAVAEMTKRIAAGIHSMCWLCWVAKYSPEECDEVRLESYDREMHLILSDLVGTRVVVAALDDSIHTSLSPLAGKLYELDVTIGKAKALYANSREKGIKALAELHDETLRFDKELLKAVTTLPSLR